jgi:hypothetical protein
MFHSFHRVEIGELFMLTDLLSEVLIMKRTD